MSKVKSEVNVADAASRVRNCLVALGASRDVLVSIADATGCYELRISDIYTLLLASAARSALHDRQDDAGGGEA